MSSQELKRLGIGEQNYLPGLIKLLRDARFCL